jgi:hypothetical protein
MEICRAQFLYSIGQSAPGEGAEQRALVSRSNPLLVLFSCLCASPPAESAGPHGCARPHIGRLPPPASACRGGARVDKYRGENCLILNLLIYNVLYVLRTINSMFRSRF